MMETPNLIDVPTRATRRMERYGVLALVFFLTTFGVLYLWEGGVELSPTSHAGGADVVRVPPSSRERPERALPSGDALTARMPRVSELPLSRMNMAQQELAQKRDDSRAEREISMEQRAAESAISRNNAARYFERRNQLFVDGDAEAGTSAVTAPRPPITSPPRSEVARGSQPLEYVVRSGDSLSMIAQNELGTVKNLQRLRDYNGLSSDFFAVCSFPQPGHPICPVRHAS